MQCTRDIECFRQCAGRIVRFINTDNDGQRLAGSPGDRFAPDHDRAERPMSDLHRMPAQCAMVPRAGAHDQKAGRARGLRQGCCHRTLDRRRLDIDFGMRRPDGSFCRGEHLPTGARFKLGDCMQQGEWKCTAGGELCGPLCAAEGGV